MADVDAVQLGARRRNAAFISRSREAKRSALPGSCRRCSRHHGSARLSTVAARSGIDRFAGPRTVRLSEKGSVGIDCTLARHWAARTQAAFSHFARFSLELL